MNVKVIFDRSIIVFLYGIFIRTYLPTLFLVFEYDYMKSKTAARGNIGMMDKGRQPEYK